MPIKSYLAHPHEGRKNELIEIISKLPFFEVTPAENQEIIIIVTDTETSVQEDKLKLTLEGIDSLNLLAMVSGFNTPKN